MNADSRPPLASEAIGVEPLSAKKRPERDGDDAADDRQSLRQRIADEAQERREARKRIAAQRKAEVLKRCAIHTIAWRNGRERHAGTARRAWAAGGGNLPRATHALILALRFEALFDEEGIVLYSKLSREWPAFRALSTIYQSLPANERPPAGIDAIRDEQLLTMLTNQRSFLTPPPTQKRGPDTNIKAPRLSEMPPEPLCTTVPHDDRC